MHITQYTTEEKYTIIFMLSEIMKADGIIHPKESDFLDIIYRKFEIKVKDLDIITDMDFIRAKNTIREKPIPKHQHAKSLFEAMARVDGFVHISESTIIDQFP